MAKIWPRDGLTLEHVGDIPITFHSEKQLRQFMREKGWDSGALL